MPAITRSWLAFAAIGTGLIHLALVIGAPAGLGVLFGVLGFAEFGWGVLTFARDRPLVPRVALVVAIVPVLLWGLLLGIASAAELPELAASLPFIPLGIASLFELFAAAVLAVHLRRPVDEVPSIPNGRRFLLAIVGGALVAAALTAPALAATQVSQLTGSGSYEFDIPGHETGH